MAHRGRKPAESAVERARVLEFYLAGLRIEEIAMRVGCTTRNVKYHLAVLRAQGLLPPSSPGPRPRQDASPAARRRRSRRTWQWLVKTLREDKLARELIAKVVVECGRPLILPQENTTFYHPAPGLGAQLTGGNLALVAVRAVAMDRRVRLAISGFGPDTDTINQLRTALRQVKKASAALQRERARLSANIAATPLLAAANHATCDEVLTAACRNFLEAQTAAEREARKVIVKLLRLQCVFEAGGDLGYALHKFQQRQCEELRQVLEWVEEAAKRPGFESQDQKKQAEDGQPASAIPWIPRMSYGQIVEEFFGRTARFGQDRLVLV